MKKIIASLLAALAMVSGAYAAGGAGIALDKFPKERLSDLAALQNGAKLFVNYCLNCHSAAFMRYNRLRDIGLTEEQIAVYDAYAEAWAIIHANLREALEATRIVDCETGGTLNSGAKSAALSIFEGTKQRFFAQLLLSMKLPSLLPAIDAALADGNAVVVQLVSTAEAMLNRRLADLFIPKQGFDIVQPDPLRGGGQPNQDMGVAN